MVESGRKRFNDRFTCCYYSAILWSEDHLFDADASINAVSVFIVFYDFASDCTTVTQGGKFSFLHKDNKSWNSGKAFAASQTAQAPLIPHACLIPDLSTSTRNATVCRP